MLQYLTKLNSQKKRDLSAKKQMPLAFCTEKVDLGLKSLHRDFMPLLQVGSIAEYRQRYRTLGDYLVPSARPSSAKQELK